MIYFYEIFGNWLIQLPHHDRGTYQINANQWTGFFQLPEIISDLRVRLTGSFQLQVCLIMYEILVDTRR